MAPGAASTPKGTGTGTVPKPKSRNNSVPREVVAPLRRERKEMQFNHVANNFTSLDFQPVSENSAQNNIRNASYPNVALLDYYDLANTAIVMPTTPNTTRRENTPHRREVTPIPTISNGNGAEGDVLAGYSAPKTSNIASERTPDRNQLEQRLQQIREYLKVTSSLMLSVNNGEGNENSENEELSRLINDLRDSESKLVAMMNENVDGTDDTDGNGASSEVVVSVNGTSVENDRPSSSASHHSSPGAQESNTLREANLRQHVQAQQDKLRALQEQQDKLRALQEQQAALHALQEQHQRAESQLRSVREAQAMLAAQSEAIDSRSNRGEQSVGDQNEVDAVQLEATVGQLQERLNNLRVESASYQSNCSDHALGNLQSLHERLARLQELTDNHNELSTLLGERDEVLTAEHRALQDKLRELNTKKQQVEKLVGDLQSLSCPPNDQERNVGNMRSQLASLHGMMNMLLRAESELNMSASSTPEPNIDQNSCDLNLTNVPVKSDNISEERERNRNLFQSELSFENPQEDATRTNRFGKKLNQNASALGSKERQQMLLKAELQAKKKELEELMRKDQDRTSVINQDVCSEGSLDKSESRYGTHSDGHAVPMWGGIGSSNHIQGQNMYSREDEADALACAHGALLNNTHVRSASISNLSVQQQQQQSGGSNNNVSKAQQQQQHQQQQQRHSSPLVMSNRDVSDMSVCSVTESVPPPMPPLWRRKHSHDGNVSNLSAEPRSNWNASWTTATANLPRANSVAGECIPPVVGFPGRQPVQPTNSWWQKKALQLQQQLELTSNLCQSMIMDQQQQSHSSSSIQNDLSPYPMQPVYGGGVGNALQMASMPYGLQTSTMQPAAYATTATAEQQCQNLIAASQLHMQTMILTSLNQCCNMLWMQQKELAALRNITTTIQENQQRAAIQDHLDLQSCGISTHPVSNSAPVTRTNQYKPSMSIVESQSDNALNVSFQQANAVPAAPFSFPTNNCNNNNNYNMQPAINNAQNFNNSAAVAQNLNTVQNPLMQTMNNVQNSAQNPNLVQNTNSIQVVPNNNAAPNFQNELPRVNVQNIGGPINWNGAQALNNQVAPGNRANNYWDNFRSYSRQNLLSTTSKSNEGSVCCAPSPFTDRSRNALRHSISGHSSQSTLEGATVSNVAPKRNTNTAQDDTKATIGKKSQLSRSASNNTPQPDVLNVNQHHLNVNNEVHHQHFVNNINAQQCSSTDAIVVPQSNVNLNQNNNDNMAAAAAQLYTDDLNLNASLDAFVSGLERSSETRLNETACENTKKCKQSSRNNTDRNEWSESTQSSSGEQSKTKLFDMLRENVYKEVSSLIAANENRPHFLIQLFRDLQLISSDRLRQRTLQSIQGVVTDSLSSLPDNGQGASRQSVLNIDSQQSSDEEESSEPAPSVSVTNSCTQQNLPEICSQQAWPIQVPVAGTKHSREIQSVLLNILPYLRANADNICTNEVLESLRNLTMQFVSTINFPNKTSDNRNTSVTSSQEQINSLLENLLNKYQGFRLREVTEEILAMIDEILHNELIYIGTSEQTGRNNAVEDADFVESAPLYQSRIGSDVTTTTFNTERIEIQSSVENGDLAEADQSHHENDEEEGAVGGGGVNKETITNDISNRSEHEIAVEDRINTEADAEWITFEPGLDCIPSRLTDTSATDNSVTSDKPTQLKE